MSGKIMGQVWDLELPHAHMLVLLAYADHADHEGNNVYPGVGLIAWKAGYSLRQAQRITDDLIAWGLLVEVDASPGKVAVYRIDLAVGKPKKPYKGRQNVTRVKMSPVTFSTPGGDILSTHGVTFSQNEKPSNGATARAKTPRVPRTNRHGNRHEEPPPPTATKNATPIGGGGGGDRNEEPTDTERFLLSKRFAQKTAHELRHLDLAAVQYDYEQSRKAGSDNGSMVLRWRALPPSRPPPAANGYTQPLAMPADTLAPEAARALLVQHRKKERP